MKISQLRLPYNPAQPLRNIEKESNHDPSCNHLISRWRGKSCFRVGNRSYGAILSESDRQSADLGFAELIKESDNAIWSNQISSNRCSKCEQVAAANAYGGGDFSHVTEMENPEDYIEEGGDTLFAFIMRELADDSGPMHAETARRRMESAIRDIQTVMDALPNEPKWIEAQLTPADSNPNQ